VTAKKLHAQASACLLLGFSILILGLPSSLVAAAEPAEYDRLAKELDGHLRDLLKRWYPRTIDRERGGFLERFGADWSPLPESGKFLVYQARLTWTAAEVASYAPDLREEYLGYARHGIAFLHDVMRDRDRGGVYFRLGLDGKPPRDPTAEKHAYGLSFAIYAGAAAYRETRDPRALELARETFRWLDRNAHDAQNGGYYESLALDGRPILENPGDRTDGIGTYVGYKSMNTHIHLLEAFTALYRVAPEAGLRERLEELLVVVRDKVAVDPGCLNLFFTPEWRPVPAHDSFGHDVETAFLLVEAAEALGRKDDPATWRMARKIVDHALEWGFDRELGGFFEKGEAFAPAHDRSKVWWTQAEGLHALLLMHERFGKESDRYWKAFRKQWGFIREHQIDPVHGEWHGQVSREGAPMGSDEKASPWKANYHNGRALMGCVRMLRRLAAES
jgi:mannobiose 2-epimerase